MTTSSGTTTSAATTTNLGPLTTIFSVPSSCSDKITTIDVVSNDLGFFQGKFGSFGDDSCYPPNILPSGISEFYSPGICPESWTSACSYPTDGISFSAETTAHVCCPPGYGCYQNGSPDFIHVCESFPTGTLTNVWAPTTTPSIFTDSQSLTSVTAPNTIAMDGVVVYYQSTDTQILALLSSQSSASLASAAKTSPPTTTTPSDTSITSQTSSTNPSSTSTTTPKSTSTGLSSTAKIAIGVIIPILILLAIASSMAFITQKKKRRKQALFSKPATNHEYHLPELQGQERYEMQAENKPVELQAVDRLRPVEMEDTGSMRGSGSRGSGEVVELAG